MSPAKKKRFDLARLPAATGEQLDERFQGATPLRRLFNKVFPDHWSFLLGEIALYSFIVLLLTGTFLALFFDPSMAETRYQGSFTPLRGIEMTQAYATSLNLSFDVRGGLIMRQMHHWAALLFMAAIVVHMFRVFFTGAFRKPREANWIIGVLLFWLGFTEGFAGYSLPDDALSGTGLRIAFAIILSIPVIGSWVATSLFGGEFPGTEILPRLYILHVFLIPLILLALITVHMGLLVKQKHTQFPGPGRTNHNVVGVRMFPTFAMKAGGFFMLVFGVIALMGGLVQINPIWLFGPYEASVVSAASQPDWYVMFLDGSTRLMPDWDLQIGALHLPRPVLADAGAARHPDRAAAALSVHRGPAAQGPPVAPPAAAPPRRTRPHRPGRHGDRVLRGAADLGWQRRGRAEAGHQPQRDDVGRPGRAAHRAADRVLHHLPGLPRPAAARPRGPGPRRGDGHHPSPARRQFIEVHQPLAAGDHHALDYAAPRCPRR
jgi:quinol-cytochrome oxidoreductase complex cytochrome b subunit